jgi:hypothetical protein
VVDTSLSGQRVARELAALIERRGTPLMIVSDNGTEFTSRAIYKWMSVGGQVNWQKLRFSFTIKKTDRSLEVNLSVSLVK